MTKAVKVWWLSVVETMAVKLRETQERRGEGNPWFAEHLVIKSVREVISKKSSKILATKSQKSLQLTVLRWGGEAKIC